MRECHTYFSGIVDGDPNARGMKYTMHIMHTSSDHIETSQQPALGRACRTCMMREAFSSSSRGTFHKE